MFYKRHMKDTAFMLERSRNIFFSHWEEMLRLRLVVLKNCEHEDIHDLRVASRRFRAALNLLRPMCRGKDVRRVAKHVRRLTRTLGELRNLDEALLFFRSHSGQIALPGLTKRLAAERESEQRLVLAALKDFKPRKLERLVREMAAGITAENSANWTIPLLPAYLSDTSIGLFDTLQSFLTAALCFENSEQRHLLRIAIKKWRYFLEIVSKIVERDNSEFLERLKKYQSLLGSMNDMTVFGKLCHESGAGSAECEAAQQITASETRRLFDEFVRLAAAEPLGYTFLI